MRILSFLLALTFLLSGAQPVSADDLSPQFDQNVIVSKSSSAITIGTVQVSDQSLMGMFGIDASIISVSRKVTGGATALWALCSELTNDPLDFRCGKPNILNSNYLFHAQLHIPVCVMVDVAPCVESVQVSQNGSGFTQGRFTGYSREGSSFASTKSDSELGLPRGESPAKFTFETPALKGIDFSVSSLFLYNAYSAEQKSFSLRSFGIEIAPVIYSNSPGARYTSFSYNDEPFGIPGTETWPVGRPTWSSGGVDTLSSPAWIENGRVALKANIPPDLRFRLSLKLPKSVPQWFFGQIDKTAVHNLVHSSYNVLTVEGNPALVQQIGFESAKAVVRDSASNSDRFANWVIRPGSAGSIQQLLDMLPEDVNSSLANESVWRFASNGIDSAGTPLKSCLSQFPSFGGMISTNAPLFDSVFPTFKDGLFEFRTAGLHFEKDNRTLNLGFYEMALPTALARCLYGFSNAPLLASISVFDDEGESKTATGAFFEKNGVLTLSVRGFTFSSPTIQAKLSQKKITVVCVSKKNYKLTKKIVGYSPACPAGYKKKK